MIVGCDMNRILFIILLCLSFTGILNSHAATSPSRVIRVAAFNHYPAIFKADDGTIKGLYVDLLEQIARKEDWQISYVFGSWAEGLERIKSGDVDVLTSVAFTEERATFMDYGKVPSLTVWSELYIRNKSDIENILHLNGKTIALMKGDFNAANFKSQISKFNLTCQYVEYSNFAEVLGAVSAGQVDGGVANNLFGTAKILDYRNIKSSGVVLNPFDLYFTVSKGKSPDILAKLDSYLKSWKNDESSPYHQARNKWLHGNAATVTVIPRWLYWSLALFLAAMLVAALFILVLRAQVRRRTQDLKKEVDAHSRTIDELHLMTVQLEQELAEKQVAEEALQEQAAVLEEEIMERERFARELQESESRFRAIFDGSSEALFVHDAETGRILDVNSTACEIFCFTREEARDLSVEEISSGIPPYTQNEAIGYISKARNGTPQSFTWQAKDRNGRHFWVENNMRSVVINDMSLIIVGVRDITDRIQRELEYKLILRTTKDGFWIADAEGHLVEVNVAYCEMSGYSRDELLAMRISDLDCLESPDDVADKINRVKQIGSGLFDTIHKCKNGTFMDVEISTSYLEEKDCFCVFIRNITDRKKAENELIRKNHEIEQFIYTVSHDLRSPLVTVKTFLGFLEHDIAEGDADKTGKDLEFIASASNRMEALLNELLDMSRLGRIPLTTIEIKFGTLLEDALDAVAGQVNTSNVNVQVCYQDIVLYGDRRRLLQIWQNLIDNALKYLGNQPSPVIRIGADSNGDDVEFYVSDNGIGIASDYHEKIFGIFEQLDRNSGGVGMGLTMVRRIVELYGGRIWVDSAGEGHGTCFRFTLPQAVSVHRTEAE